MNRIVVTAPARLHFGMFRFAADEGLQFGGVGMMVDAPAVDVAVSPADEFQVLGRFSRRAEASARGFCRIVDVTRPPACAIEVRRAPPGHTGLGTGTQVALAVAAGLNRHLNQPDMTAIDLARATGRGQRSAIGTYGFLHGGLIVDHGKRPGDELGQLRERHPLPEDWRVVLVCPSHDRGLHGPAEVRAFARLPTVPATTTERLEAITVQEMLPALKTRNCDAFGEAVYEFGKLAGSCFAEVQGGPFASPEIARTIHAVRAFGVTGAGQSSWGPTVFAIATDKQAQDLVAHLLNDCKLDPSTIALTRPSQSGAVFVNESA